MASVALGVDGSGEVSEVERRRRLAHHVASAVANGRRVETQSDFQAVLVKGHRVNHVLHLILTLVTVGLWAPVWLLMVFVGGEKREILQVDEFGNVSVTRL